MLGSFLHFCKGLQTEVLCSFSISHVPVCFLLLTFCLLSIFSVLFHPVNGRDMLNYAQGECAHWLNS